MRRCVHPHLSSEHRPRFEHWRIDARDGPLTKLLNSVTGPVAFIFSVIALVVFGAALLFGSDLNAFVRGLLVIMMIISVVVFAKNLLASVFGIGAVANSLAGVNLVNLVLVGTVVALGAIGMGLDIRSAKRRAAAFAQSMQAR